ncbi:PhnD/SsuA/transferrin family substrate-binding protein [uncultured Tateyamaria sp.]|uniref:phosphate/phosphite/phosphonate ABC transporter substrate-binding protein n=1 Tax=uncultured Tateyamaria sp. TaxID=455651 RepID=UPI002615CEB1|nr:PhnD/SsuA/transferrin family substrate-binding protein [uncultured Tateyamaria sp.]
MPHLRGAHDRLWDGIRQALGYGPPALSRGGAPWAERQSRTLVLAQTCGLPYRAKLHGHVVLVGTPDYDLPGCPPGHYFSYLIRRTGEERALNTLLDQGVMAFNDGLSQSGWAAPLAHVAPRRPAQVLQTGGHVASIDAVRSGDADVAAIDALTYLLWCDAHPADATDIDAFDQTAPTPTLPYITALKRDPIPIARALRSAIAGLSPTDRAALRLKGLVQIPASAYLALPVPPSP